METTLAIIKPDAYKDGKTGKIIDRIISEDFKIKNMKQINMTKKNANQYESSNQYSLNPEHNIYDSLFAIS